jgi:hypothetical protein
MTNNRFLILNRWDDEFAEYHKYIDHRSNHISYITTEAGLSRLNSNEAEMIKILENLDPGRSLDEAVQSIIQRLGKLDGIICLSEFDLLTAAQLRAKFGIPGVAPDIVIRFKDKTVMKETILSAGIPAPSFVEASDFIAIDRLIIESGFPLILKPKVGAASKGVYKINDGYELNHALNQENIFDYECENYLQGSIYHIDGLIRDGAIQFIKPSRYINTCLGFTQGEPLGSVLIDPGSKFELLVDFTNSCLRALGLTNGAFHLEVIEDEKGKLYFLEIGARVGGGEIPFVIRDLFGIDLVGEWLRIEFGLPPINSEGSNKSISGGFLMIPEPKNLPCKVVNRTSLLYDIPEIYNEILPQVGDVFESKGSYDRISGRFHFKGDSEKAVETAIRKAIQQFQIDVISSSSELVGTDDMIYMSSGSLNLGN